MTLNVTVPDAVYRQIAELARSNRFPLNGLYRRPWLNNFQAGPESSKSPGTAAANVFWPRWTRFPQAPSPHLAPTRSCGSFTLAPK